MSRFSTLRKYLLRVFCLSILLVLYNDCTSGFNVGNTPGVNSGTQAAGSSSSSSSSSSGGSSSSSSGGSPGGSTTSTVLTGLHVVMGSGGAAGHIVNGAGQNVLFHGVDHTYTEDSCTTSGGGVFTDDGDLVQADINVMKSWKINIVRVPLNEDCWLNINGVPLGGAKYQADVQNLVNLLTSNGIAVILDLHWAAPGATESEQGIEQVTMADADHAMTFWSQVAAAYASKGASDNSPNSMILFDLFNEPYIGTGTAADWNCWVSGGCTVLNSNSATMAGTNGSPGLAAGMAQLLQAVRNAAGSPQNVVMMGGLGFSGNVSQWLSKVNSIPSINGTSIANVVLSWHIYSDSAGTWPNQCPNQWNGYGGTCPSGALTAQDVGITGILSAGFPVLIGEIGVNYQTAQNFSWFNDLMNYMDTQEQGYLSWTWNTSAGPQLLSTRTYPSSLNSSTVSSYATQQGQTFYQHLQKF